MNYVDRMQNGLKPEWQVLNSAPGGVVNQITYSPRGVRMRNDQFDITGPTFHFSLLLNFAIKHEHRQVWQVTLVPGELTWGKMEYFLHDSLTDAVGNTNSGPFGITQHWDDNLKKSFLYMQHGSSMPIEDTKIEIVEGNEPIFLRLLALGSGRIRAIAISDQWDDPMHIFGDSNQDSFNGIDLFPCLHNCKSFSSADGANLWRAFKAFKI